MAKKEVKSFEIGFIPVEHYDAAIRGAAKQFRRQLKAQAQNRELVFDEKQTDEEFVKMFLFNTLIGAYKQNEASLAGQDAQIKKKAEIDSLLSLK